MRMMGKSVQGRVNSKFKAGNKKDGVLEYQEQGEEQ